ncbi:hypothetical protein CBM2634_U170004 [Cupriavidus taiwanensis]|uniref:Uncharacterized protein n=1 Tax=Cupriavidus taiwanensis TaxID=164546 RepID=A0A375JEY6_9BURK|nr:hypothetical protein CBM2634_U170004 [Cupriavidus taiwanensis]
MSKSTVLLRAHVLPSSLKRDCRASQSNGTDALLHKQPLRTNVDCLDLLQHADNAGLQHASLMRDNAGSVSFAGADSDGRVSRSRTDGVG